MGFLSALIYVIVSFTMGGLLILISLNSLNFAHLEDAFITIYSAPNLRIIAALIGLLIILVCIRTIQSSIVKAQREKTIAFEGSFGEVSISLSAVEDMIKKLLLEFKELKEIRPHVTASKKGLQVLLRIMLSSYTNIPEFTAKIQNLVKNKLQHMLGIEEDINVRVEIRKILYTIDKSQKKGEQTEDLSIPYRNY